VKAPLSWLRDYVDIQMDIDELASLLALTALRLNESPKWESPEATGISAILWWKGSRVRASS
jgi:hypothetical protein